MAVAIIIKLHIKSNLKLLGKGVMTPRSMLLGKGVMTPRSMLLGKGVMTPRSMLLGKGVMTPRSMLLGKGVMTPRSMLLGKGVMTPRSMQVRSLIVLATGEFLITHRCRCCNGVEPTVNDPTLSLSGVNNTPDC